MSRLEAKWIEYCEANPHVFDWFLKEALELKEAGCPKYSIQGLVEVFRWLSRKGVIKTDGFKISNDHAAYYARALMWCEPELRGFFDVRPLKEEPEWWPPGPDAPGGAWP